MREIGPAQYGVVEYQANVAFEWRAKRVSWAVVMLGRHNKHVKVIESENRRLGMYWQGQYGATLLLFEGTGGSLEVVGGIACKGEAGSFQTS